MYNNLPSLINQVVVVVVAVVAVVVVLNIQLLVDLLTFIERVRGLLLGVTFRFGFRISPGR